MESSGLQELEQIPGVGKTIARDMQNIGIHSIDALKGRPADLCLEALCEGRNPLVIPSEAKRSRGIY